MKIFILILYFILIISCICLCFYAKKKMISKMVKSNDFIILNHRFVFLANCLLLNIALVVGVIGIFVTEENILYYCLDILVTMLVNFLLIYLMILYPVYGSLVLVSSTNTLYYVCRSNFMEFDYDRIHFERKKHKTLMYYKDELVITTKQNIKKVKLNK